MLIADLERNPGFHPPRDVAASTDSLVWATAFMELYRQYPDVMLDPVVVERWFRAAIVAGYAYGCKTRHGFL